MWPSLFCGFVGFALYLNTLTADFAYDDSRAIEKNQDLHADTPWQNIFVDDFWGTPLTHSGSHKSYRPLCVLTFRWNYLLGELNPYGYHLTNILLHAVVVATFTSLSQFLLKSQLLGIVSGLVFASHPIHTEAVAGIVGRAEIGAALFFLLSFKSYIKYCQCRDAAILQVHDPISRRRLKLQTFLYLMSSLVCAVCSMLWKEQAITVLAINITYDIFVWNKIPVFNIFHIFYKTKYRAVCISILITAVWSFTVLSSRMAIMGLSPPEFSPSDNPASNSSSLLTRSLTFSFLPVFNIWLLLNPHILSFDWSMEAIPLIESLSDIRNAGTFVFYASLVTFALYCINGLQQRSENGVDKNKNKGFQSNGTLYFTYFKYLQRNDTLVYNFEILIVAFSILIIPFIPATNIFFYVGFVVAERVLYIPSMGYSLLLVYGVHVLRSNVKRTHQRCISCCMVALLMLFSVRTVLRNQDWQTEEALYRSGIKTNPAKAWGNLGNVLKVQGKMEEAEMAYRNALKHRSNMADAHYNLGILLQESDRNEEAIETYQNAIRYRPKLAMAHLNLGITLAKIGMTEEAKQVYRHTATLNDVGLKDPKTQNKAIISAVYNLGRLLHDEGKYQEALETLQEAIRQCPDYYAPQSLYNMMGDCLSKLGRYDDAEKWFKKSLAVKSDHVPAYLTYAHLLDLTGRSKEAEEMLDKAVEMEPENANVYQHYGQHFADSKQYQSAAAMYQKAVEMDNNDFEILFNAANAHRQAGLNDKAELYYWKAVNVKPQEATAHMNLGAMLHVNGKLREAEIHYLKALRLKPDDEVTKGNLKKVRTLIKKQAMNNKK
ncbi:protein O-mannosyl-transferase TMTC2-like [Ptychodera flava]|uniref:protein O-mannosyl-transferase TMTC2-like n=1 Tax=Ptychodera flava TaxID=63121 RepID=UPI003969EB9F